ncbi:MAG: hypothetical protein OEO18_15470 [Gammaproteobacteria bacterium]|nr:hypothetical protein [Gammaproteobacteria bacterium]
MILSTKHIFVRFSTVIMFLVFFLVGCGGGDGDDNGGGFVRPNNQGFFLDDAVNAITYEWGGNPPRLTDENGVFEYRPGTPIQFSVDGIILGTVEPQFGRVLPTDFGTQSVTGLNILQFIQSIDQKPAEPGIDLAGVSLPNVQLNFSSNSFATDPDVIAAVAAAGPSGGGTGTGSLVDRATAFNRLQASTGLQFNTDGSDFENQVYFPISPGVNEPCLAFFSDIEASPNSGRLEGWGICRDDILLSSDPVEEFEWRMDITNLELEIPTAINPEERVTVQRRGNTGTRIHAILFNECVPCDPNVEPVFTEEVQTFLPAIVLPSFTGTTLLLTASSDGSMVEIDFDNSDNTGTLDNGDTFTWALEFQNKVLELRGTGNQGDILLYHRLVLIEGSVNNGRMMAILATARDTDNSGDLNDAEISAPTYEAIEEFTS